MTPTPLSSLAARTARPQGSKAAPSRTSRTSRTSHVSRACSQDSGQPAGAYRITDPALGQVLVAEPKPGFWLNEQAVTAT